MSVPFFTRASEENTATRHRCADAIVAGLVAVLTVASLYIGLALVVMR